jgi:hypothetical protein
MTILKLYMDQYFKVISAPEYSEFLICNKNGRFYLDVGAILEHSRINRTYPSIHGDDTLGIIVWCKIDDILEANKDNLPKVIKLEMNKP